MNTSSDSKQSSPQDIPAKPEDSGGKGLAPGQSWKQNEEHVLPHNRLGIVFFGLMSCTFLAALDQVSSKCCYVRNLLTSKQQTIVATALPTIVHQLGGGKEYSWVGR